MDGRLDGALRGPGPEVVLALETVLGAGLAPSQAVGEPEFVAEVVHDSTVVVGYGLMLHRTVRMLSPPLVARRKDPMALFHVSRGAVVELVDPTGRQRLSKPVGAGCGTT